jgi:hypothetical protein
MKDLSTDDLKARKSLVHTSHLRCGFEERKVSMSP